MSSLLGNIISIALLKIKGKRIRTSKKDDIIVFNGIIPLRSMIIIRKTTKEDF